MTALSGDDRQSGGQQGPGDGLSGSNQGNLEPGVSGLVTSNNAETRGMSHRKQETWASVCWTEAHSYIEHWR